MKTKFVAKRMPSGHAFIEGVIAMGVLFILLMLFVSLCASPLAGYVANWMGVADGPMNFKQSFGFAFKCIYGMLAIFMFGQLLIEWPASVLNLNLGNGGYSLKLDEKYKVLGTLHYSKQTVWVRWGFKVFAIVASLLIGYWVATNFAPARLSPQAVMLFASMSALVPIAMLFAIMGKLSPELRQFMTTRTVFVPVKA
jgi:hypothetical protein